MLKINKKRKRWMRKMEKRFNGLIEREFIRAMISGSDFIFIDPAAGTSATVEVHMQLNDMQRAIDMVRNQQIDNMKWKLLPPMMFGMKAMNKNRFIDLKSN